MQHHIIWLRVLDLNIRPTCLSFLMLSALMDAQADKQSVFISGIFRRLY